MAFKPKSLGSDKRAIEAMKVVMMLTQNCRSCGAKSSRQRLAETSDGLLCGSCADERGLKGEYMAETLKQPEPPKPEAPKPQSFGDWS